MSAKRTVNARKLAANRAELQGSVQIQALTGAHDRLAEPDGVLEYSMAFGFTKDGEDSLAVINLELQAEVSLRCQRSLQPFRQVTRSKSQVVLVADVAQAELMSEDYEPFACADIELNIEDLLTEELLLALPLVAIDPESEKFRSANDEQTNVGEQDQHPFAGLAALKKDLAAKQ